jgi:hypothetical protein
MKINVSKIAFFYLRLFFPIEIFQWVTADSNKKIPPRPGLGIKGLKPAFIMPLHRRLIQARGFNPRLRGSIARTSLYGKQLSIFSESGLSRGF